MKLKMLTRLLAIGSGSALGVALMYSNPALAVDYGVELKYDYIYTDNINLVPVNTQGDHIHQYTVGFSLDHKSPKLDAEVKSSIQYRDYVSNLADDDTFTTINARALFKISPQHFTWLVQSNTDQTKINRNSTATPNNTQRTNVFITGPDYTIRINPVNNIVFMARYIDVAYETSDLDNERDVLGVSWVYRVNSKNTLSLNLVEQQVDFTNEILNTNYERGDWFLRLETKPGKNIITLDAGRTVIRRRGMPDLDGDLQRFTWARTINTNSQLNLQLSRQLSDAGQELSGVAESTEVDTSSSGNFTNSDIFFSERADFSYTLKKGSFAYQLSLFYADDDFETTPNDETRKGGTFSIAYNITPTVIGTLSLTGTNTEFLNIDREDRDTIKDLNVEWRLARRFSLNFSAIRNERKSVGINRDVDYVEHRYSVGVSYLIGKNVEKK